MGDFVLTEVYKILFYYNRTAMPLLWYLRNNYLDYHFGIFKLFLGFDIANFWLFFILGFNTK